MITPVSINLVFEDDLSGFVLRRIIRKFGGKFQEGYSYNGNGFGYIKSKINGFNQASVVTPFLVLTDLDNGICPSKLIGAWFKGPMHKNMLFRIAVKEVEAWLMADREGLSTFFGISRTLVPSSPESINDPKNTLISLARRSRKRVIREDIVPINETASIGPNYNGRLMQFVFGSWDLDNAMGNSRSLTKAIKKLEDFSI